MKGIVITGHGHFAQGINSLIEGIIGRTEQLAVVPFSFDSNAAELKESLRKAALAIDSGDGVIFCTDILGGTPFNKASELAFMNMSYQVLTGSNFTLINAAISLREDDLSDEQLIHEIVTNGREAITSLAEKISIQNKGVGDGF